MIMEVLSKLYEVKDNNEATRSSRMEEVEAISGHRGDETITIEHLNGEVKPLEAKVGDMIPGGTRNFDVRMITKATKTWKESSLIRIVQLTEEAQSNKPKLQRWLDEFGMCTCFYAT